MRGKSTPWLSLIHHSSIYAARKAATSRATMMAARPSSAPGQGALPGGHWREERNPEGLVLESWGQGLSVGSLVVMVCLTLAAMRGHVLLHSLIMAEVSPLVDGNILIDSWEA